MKFIVALSLIIGLSGCSTMLTGSLCTAGPIIPDKGATTRWTRHEKEQIVVLNEAGAKVCGWHS